MKAKGGTKMAELASYHVPEGSPKQVAKINLYSRLQEAEEAKRHPGAKPPPQPEPAPQPAPAAPPVASRQTGGAARHLIQALAGTAAVVLVAAAGLMGYQRYVRHPKPVAVTAPTVRSSATPVKTLPQPGEAGTGAPAQTPAPQPVSGASYTVQPGDTLITIGEQIDKDWQQIAALNGITDPWIIHPGQVLRLP